LEIRLFRAMTSIPVFFILVPMNFEHETEVVFSAKNLIKNYRVGDFEVHALRAINLTIHQGEMIVLLGPSGSGKSTLLNILGGLDNPTSGDVFYKDHNLVTSSSEELTLFRREHVGFVFQFYNLIPSLTAVENVALASEISLNPMPAILALDLVGLKDKANHFPSQLSGGEQQRIAIARAVAKRPDILLCDEPTGALDYETGKKVLESIIKVNQEVGSIVAIITHNASISGLGDRIIHLANGKITAIEKNRERKNVDDIRW
jgi:putative ABC transport system ATP-binding protein